MFLSRNFMFRHLFSKGSHNITWKGAFISLLFLWGSYHNWERPRQTYNFANISCLILFLKTLEIKSSIPSDTTYMRKILLLLLALRWRRKRGHCESRRCCIRLEVMYRLCSYLLATAAWSYSTQGVERWCLLHHTCPVAATWKKRAYYEHSIRSKKDS